MPEHCWYEDLRSKWKPEKINLLLIGESPPDGGGDPAKRRFFYAERLSQSDNLFRSVIHALYNSWKLTKGEFKTPWHQKLFDDGVYLIDLAPVPVNHLSSIQRRKILRGSVEGCVEKVLKLGPAGVVVCHTPSFGFIAEPLRDAGVLLLHDAPIPFPLGNKRAEFVEKMRAAVTRLPSD